MNKFQTRYLEAKACYDAAVEDMQFRVSERYPDPFGLTEEEEEKYLLFVEKVDSERQVGAARDLLYEAEEELLTWAQAAALRQPLKKAEREALTFLFERIGRNAHARDKVINLALRWKMDA